jgi:Starch-binding associating with outer membrane
MKIIYKSFFILFILLGACQEELTKINVNPNNLQTPDVNTLTTSTILNTFWNNVDQAWLTGNGIGQLMVITQSYYQGQFGTQSLPYQNVSYWTQMFANARDAATITTQAKAAKNPGNQAVGLTLEAYAFSQLTDGWGDIPFKQALQGASGNYLAEYDDQQTVYTAPVIGILAKLYTADSLLANSNSVIGGDVLYGGNTTKWREFINGLRLRFLLRISGKQDPTSAMQSIFTENVLFKSASESAALKLTTSLPWIFPSYLDRTGDFAYKTMDSLLYDFYVSTGDKDRLTLFWAPSPNGVKNPNPNVFNNYGGLNQVSNSAASATTAQINSSSLFSNTLYPTAAPVSAPLTYARVITYSEVQYILAEAALKGYVPGGAAAAATFFNNGILGSYAELGLPSADATAYAAANPLNTDPILALNQIIMQKWALNLNNSYEGWLEQRRTGIPVFDLRYNSNGGKIAVKFLYPTDEQFINSTNYNKEMQKLGGKDNADYRAWW